MADRHDYLVLSHVLDKHFGASGQGIGKQAAALQEKLPPQLMKDLHLIARAQEAYASFFRFGAPTTHEVDAALQRVWTALRTFKTPPAGEAAVVAEDSAEVVSTPGNRADSSRGIGFWLMIVIGILVLRALSR